MTLVFLMEGCGYAPPWSSPPEGEEEDEPWGWEEPSEPEYDDTGGHRYARHVYTYDTAGRVVAEESDYEDNGDYEWWQYFTYDEAGRVLAWEHRDGEDEAPYTESYSYDAEGRRQTWQKTDSTSGSVSFRCVYLYDELGRLSVQTYSSYGSYNEDIYTYDEAGRVVRIDVNVGSGHEHIETFAWDDAGHLLAWADDTDADDVPEWGYDWTWDEDGRPATLVNWEADPDRTFLWTYGYDTDGRLATIEETNSESDYAKLAVYTHDAQGRLVEVLWDYAPYDDHFDMDQRRITTYDESGNEIRYAWDYEADGSVDGWVDYTYDENRLLQTSSLRYSPDEEYVRGTYVYEDTWRLSYVLWDYCPEAEGWGRRYCP